MDPLMNNNNNNSGTNITLALVLDVIIFDS